MPRTPPLESATAFCYGLVKELGFTVPLRYSWKYVGVRPFRYGRVRWIDVSRVEPPHVRVCRQQTPPKKVAKKRPKVVEDDSSSDGSCDGEPLSLAEEVECELARGNALWHSMRLYLPPFTCGQCNRAVYLWCICCDGCVHCLVGVECLAQRFKDRDEVKWVLQKWEKGVQVETILHPSPSMNVDGSSASVVEALSTPPDPVPPSSIPSGIIVTAPFCDHPASPTGCPSAEQILADVCKAPFDSQGSFRPSLSKAEALLGNNWRPPLHVTVLGLSPQQFEFEARHLRDLTTESYVTDCAQIVVYYGWAAQAALSADWDTMGVAWVVCECLRNASCASAQLLKQLVGSWAKRALEASSIHMSFAPPLIVAHIYTLSNSHWVLRLLLIVPTRGYLCLKFDPMCDRPHIVGAKQEELAVVDLIAEQEGVEPQQRKKWSKSLDAFGALAFAIAPVHSTFI